MTTRKQIKSNHKNAQKSTGPKTASGRNRAKLNALKHGLTGDHVTTFDENPDHYKKFQSEIVQSLAPAGAFEEQLAERIAMCAWRLRRIPRIEGRLFLTKHLELVEQEAFSAARTQHHEVIARIEANDPQSPALVEAKATFDHFISLVADAKAEKHDVIGNIGTVFGRLSVDKYPLPQLSRYEAGIERSMFRALHDLERLQARRRGDPVVSPLAVELRAEG
jgi:hypothetical protein